MTEARGYGLRATNERNGVTEGDFQILEERGVVSKERKTGHQHVRPGYFIQKKGGEAKVKPESGTRFQGQNQWNVMLL